MSETIVEALPVFLLHDLSMLDRAKDFAQTMFEREGSLDLVTLVRVRMHIRSAE